jgi:hypothetical protein
MFLRGQKQVLDVENDSRRPAILGSSGYRNLMIGNRLYSPCSVCLFESKLSPSSTNAIDSPCSLAEQSHQINPSMRNKFRALASKSWMSSESSGPDASIRRHSRRLMSFFVHHQPSHCEGRQREQSNPARSSNFDSRIAGVFDFAEEAVFRVPLHEVDRCGARYWIRARASSAANSVIFPSLVCGRERARDVPNSPAQNG